MTPKQYFFRKKNGVCRNWGERVHVNPMRFFAINLKELEQMI